MAERFCISLPDGLKASFELTMKEKNFSEFVKNAIMERKEPGVHSLNKCLPDIYVKEEIYTRKILYKVFPEQVNIIRSDLSSKLWKGWIKPVKDENKYLSPITLENYTVLMRRDKLESLITPNETCREFKCMFRDLTLASNFASNLMTHNVELSFTKLYLENPELPAYLFDLQEIKLEGCLP